MTLMRQALDQRRGIFWTPESQCNLALVLGRALCNLHLCRRRRHYSEHLNASTTWRWSGVWHRQPKLFPLVQAWVVHQHLWKAGLYTDNICLKEMVIGESVIVIRNKHAQTHVYHISKIWIIFLYLYRSHQTCLLSLWSPPNKRRISAVQSMSRCW